VKGKFLDGRPEVVVPKVPSYTHDFPRSPGCPDSIIRSVHTTNVGYSLAAKFAETSFATCAAKNPIKVKQIR
jgi:hypothetical protein